MLVVYGTWPIVTRLPFVNKSIEAFEPLRVPAYDAVL